LSRNTRPISWRRCPSRNVGTVAIAAVAAAQQVAARGGFRLLTLGYFGGADQLDMLIEPIVQEHQADQLAALSEQE
jgi:hypothetical protein